MRTLTLDLGEGVEAWSTLRRASNPADPYDGFNACGYTGDDAEHVAACRSLLPRPFVMPRQTHSLNVLTVCGPGEPHDVDALVTCERGLMLCINTADCVPIVMADAEAGVVAAAHSGWKGTVGRIAALTLRRMCELGADVRRVRVAMGPCIGPDCFEVGRDVADRFVAAGLGDAVIERTPRPYVDLGAAVRHTLMDEGVDTSNIAMPVACSRCNPADWCSARAVGVASARTLTAVTLCGGPCGVPHGGR